MALPEKEYPQKEEQRTIEEAERFQIPPEMAEWLKEVEVEPQIPADLQSQGVVPSGSNVPVFDDTTSPVPLTQTQIRPALHKKAQDAVRWLAEWCIRQLKVLHERMNTPLKVQ
ncbi:MAG TPA: hypothetical protein VJ179_00295 [Patescibacteria group bacterium]|nr:hypothetical protein [Patescibacteria group bacterium]